MNFFQKHSKLKSWDMFKEYFNLAKEKSAMKSAEIHTVEKSVTKAAGHLKKLEKSDFFGAQTKLESLSIDFNKQFASYMDNDHDNMKCAARYYLKEVFGENVEFIFGDKPKGIQVSPMKYLYFWL